MFGVIPGGAFGMLMFLMAVPMLVHEPGINALWLLMLAMLMLELTWLTVWRPCLVVGRAGLALRWSFGRVDIPYSRISHFLIPPETPGFVVVLNDGSQSRISGFGSSLISRMLGSRQEKRILKRIETMRERHEDDPDAEVTKRFNWFTILLPTTTLLTFITCVIIIENTSLT